MNLPFEKNINVEGYACEPRAAAQTGLHPNNRTRVSPGETCIIMDYDTADATADTPSLDRTQNGQPGDGEALLARCRRIFSVSFYLAQLSDPPEGIDAFAHYCSTGWRLRLAPSPLFSSSFYSFQHPQIIAGEEAPLLHYLREGYTLGLSPHPLFDVDYYLAQVGEIEEPPLIHYISIGGENVSPHPLFDVDYYRAQLPSNETSDETPLLAHYILTGHSKGLNPHPLFNTSFYRQQRSDVAESGMNVLEHYLYFGHREGVKPHPLFDRDYFFAKRPPTSDSDSNPLVEFVNHADHSVSPHQLFDVAYYLTQLDSKDIPRPHEHPIIHYLRQGHLLGLDPNPLFVTDYYRTTILHLETNQSDPLTHYLIWGRSGERAGVNPHPLFDNDWYRAQHPELSASTLTPLEHYLAHWHECEQLNPCNGFSTAYYVAKRPSCISSRVPPPHHYYSYARAPLDVPGETLPYPSEGAEQLYHQCRGPLGASRDISPVRMIFTCHDASRTSVALIILNLLRELRTTYDVECFTLLQKGGELVSEFEKYSKVINCEELARQHGITNFSLFVMAMDRPGRTLALCNSVECGYLVRLLSSLGVPCVSLIHEFVDACGKENVASIIKLARQTVFPSEMTKNIAVHMHGDDLPQVRKAIVAPQGLFDSSLLNGNKAASKSRLVTELGVSPKSSIIVGCGTVQPKNGCDLFVLAARDYLSKHPNADVTFVWIGKTLEADRSFRSAITNDLYRGGLEKQVLFIGERDNRADYLWAADAFLLTSRCDAFSCEMLEAMAAGLPVVMFDRVVGSVEAISNGEGIAVPFLDLGAMVDALALLLSDSELRACTGERAQAKIRKEYLWTQYCRKIMEVCRSVLETPKIGTFERPAANDVVNSCRNASERSLKIFFSVNDWIVSGVNSVFERLVCGLNDKGWDAQLLFTQRQARIENTHLPQCRSTNLPLHVAATTNERWRSLQAYLVKHSPCILVQGFDFITNSIAPALSDNIGVVNYVQSDDYDYYEQCYRLGPYLNRLVAVSEHIKEVLNSYNPALGSKTAVIRNSSVMPTELVRRSAARSKDSPLKLIYTGRFVEHQKRILEFIPLVSELELSGMNYTLTLVGDDEDCRGRGKLEAALKREIRMGRVQLINRKTPAETRRIVAEHDCFVLLSDFEGMPLSVVEAMGVGCVPVTTDIRSGIPELVRDGENGFIVKDRNLGVMVSRLLHLSRDPDRLLRMSIAATETIAKSLTARDMIDQIDHLLIEVSREILDGSFRRPRTLTARSPIGDVLPPPSFVGMAHL